VPKAPNLPEQPTFRNPTKLQTSNAIQIEILTMHTVVAFSGIFCLFLVQWQWKQEIPENSFSI